MDSRRVFVHGKELNLTAKEFDLLELLMAHPNKVYSRNELLDTIWAVHIREMPETVDVHVRRLREKIEENPGEPCIFIQNGALATILKDDETGNA